jgi:hypothetical protein
MVQKNSPGSLAATGTEKGRFEELHPSRAKSPTKKAKYSDASAEARAAIEFAKAALPRLTIQGIGTIVPGLWRQVFGGPEFDRDRATFSTENVATAIAFLRRCIPIKVPTQCSYALKHAAERWGAAHGMSHYITNGEFIAAAAYLGFPIAEEPRSLNVLIGVGVKQVQELDPACLWSRKWWRR